MGRPTTPALSPQRIVAEATALIDEEGLAALTTRRLAARLGIKGPSIYNHFATMDAVADAVINSLLDTVDTNILQVRRLAHCTACLGAELLDSTPPTPRDCAADGPRPGYPLGPASIG